MAPPGVGGKRITHNTRERVLSGDHNREQAVHDQMLAEFLRCLTDADHELDQKAGSVEAFGTGLETLQRGTVLAGIRPRPEIGTVNLFIEPGMLTLIDNAAPTVDESRLAYVVDPGVQTAGVLTLTPGSGGAIRIDVIECQRVETVLESDSRDIFDPSTGLFTPVLVNKVTAGRLAYRIRTGTAGAGFPGTASGWLPLAVCAVPSAATTWNDVTLWDVRPLAHERVQQPFSAYPELNYSHRHNVTSDITTSPGAIRVRGVVDVSLGGYRAGGQLIGPGTTNQYIDVADTTLWASSFSSANAPWYLYGVFPFGLPRWVQYCPSSAGVREPRGLRGIPVVARWTPRYDGRPLTAIAQTPAWTGLLDTASQDAVVLLAGIQGPAGGPYGVLGDGRVIHFVDDPGLTASATASSGNVSSQFTLTDNVNHAGNARAVYLKFMLTISVTVQGRIDFGSDVLVGGPNNALTNVSIIASPSGPSQSVYVDAVTSITIDFMQRVPLALDQTYGGARAFKVQWNHSLAGTATWSITTRQARVMGWELGP
jgi:hypothetical protein